VNFDLRKRVDLGVKNRGKWFAKASATNFGSVIILVPIDSSTNKIANTTQDTPSRQTASRSAGQYFSHLI
jgi:hypothetical protein